MDKFGFDAIFDEGANEQEPAEPAEVEDSAEETAEAEGEREQEAAEPADEQSEEDNARYASIRRRAEKEADLKIQKAVEQATKDTESKFLGMLGGLGLSNPYTGKGLATMEDLSAYAEAMREEQQKVSVQKMEQAGYSQEEIESVISALVANHPDVRKATESLGRLEKMERDAEDARVKKHIDKEIETIKKYDPAMTSFEAVVQSEHGAGIIDKVKRGYSLSDAFYLENKDTINQRTAEVSKQEAMNAARGKDHLQKSVSHGDGGVVLSSEELTNYQRLNPDMSVDEIRAWVAKDRKRMNK